MRGKNVLDDEEGAAILIAILVGALLAGIGAVLITLTTTETLLSATHRMVQETSVAADAAFERALRDLASLPDWSLVLAPPPSNVQSTFIDGQSQLRAPDAQTLDLQTLTLRRQTESNLTSGPAAFGADSPAWRLFAHSDLQAILPPASPAQPAYLVVWVADDGWDGDGDPTKDSNGRLLVVAEAYGGGGARRRVEGVVARPAGDVLRVLTRRNVH